jgi:signal transduction histidine kinase
MAVRAPGVGPSIVKSLVEMMGGAVDVQSAPGIGSIFSTTVPLWREQNAEAVEPTAV